MVMAAGSIDILLAEPLWIAILKVPALWMFMVSSSGYFFGIVAFNAGHHHPQITHEGDQLASLDFGYYQMGATIDRIEASKFQFMILSHFGQHTLHHLFPTIDHGLLPQLQSTFIETCKEFEVNMRKFPWHELMIGQFRQIARIEKSSLC
ncbi:unnamed protein product [Diamesa tonsa]